MWIVNAEVKPGFWGCVRVVGARIVEIADRAGDDDVVVDARFCAVLPGLHDHHIHLYASAAARRSVDCGPGRGMEGVARALRGAGGDGWVRGVGFCESAGRDIDLDWLDGVMPARPVRVLHRTGRCWYFNSVALDVFAAGGADLAAFERVDDDLSGRLFDGDDWLAAQKIDREVVTLGEVSRELAGLGVTAVTDASYRNDAAVAAQFFEARRTGELLQQVYLMGRLGARGIADQGLVPCLALKIHLHDNDFPDFEETVTAVRAAHALDLGVAVHVVTEADLVFAMAVIREAGTNGKDRIEHAAIVMPEFLAELRALGVSVVTQPHFVARHGDRYAHEFSAEVCAGMYRCGGFLAAGIPLAAGSDSPYGSLNPWEAMQAAVERDVRFGGASEALSPMQALGLYLGEARELAAGAPADLVILDRGWGAALERLGDVKVRATMISGHWAVPPK